jgi:hypothetical protein
LLRQAQDNHKGQLEELSPCVLLAGEMVLNVRSSGSGTLPNYSADKHTIVQMSGEQRLLLLPPAAHRRLRPFPKVRKRVFSRHLYIEMIICQDRLGTIIGKTQNRVPFSCSCIHLHTIPR